MLTRSPAPVLSALVTALVVALATLATPVAPAAVGHAPSAREEVTVSGSVGAVQVGELGLCRRSCITADGFGVDDTEGAPEVLDAPDFYAVPTTDGRFSVTAQTGRYRIAFRGRVVRGEPAGTGYLRRHRSGAYTLVDSFLRGTRFIVAEATDLGRLPVRAEVSGKVDGWGTLHTIGGSYAYADVTAARIPRGTTLTITSHGCGQQRTRQVVRRSGSFTVEWRDRHADRHYSRSLQLRAVLSKPGHLSRRLDLVTWQIPRSWGWRCR